MGAAPQGPRLLPVAERVASDPLDRVSSLHGYQRIKLL
jgi:hypothetical protein